MSDERCRNWKLVMGSDLDGTWRCGHALHGQRTTRSVDGQVEGVAYGLLIDDPIRRDGTKVILCPPAAARTAATLNADARCLAGRALRGTQFDPLCRSLRSLLVSVCGIADGDAARRELAGDGPSGLLDLMNRLLRQQAQPLARIGSEAAAAEEYVPAAAEGHSINGSRQLACVRTRMHLPPR